VEMLNLRMRRNAERPVKLRQPYEPEAGMEG
jgi:hypothetical protein